MFCRTLRNSMEGCNGGSSLFEQDKYTLGCRSRSSSLIDYQDDDTNTSSQLPQLRMQDYASYRAFEN